MAYELSYQSIYIILYISIIHMTHKNYFCPLRDMPYNLTNESFLKALKLYYFFPCKMHFKIYMYGFHEGDAIVHSPCPRPVQWNVVHNIDKFGQILMIHFLILCLHIFYSDYPDFYSKLYSMFEPQVFSAKYRARFFYLADTFLTST